MMDFGTKMFRSVLLALAGNKAAERFALRYGLRLGASKFVAGETLEAAVRQVQDLNRKSIVVTLDHLGEGVTRLEEAALYRDAYLEILDAIAAHGLQANVSLKPTQMGLALSPDAAYANIRRIVEHAADRHNYVRIDMENSPYTDATLDMVMKLHAEGLTQVGTVIQAYLYRSEEDVRRLTDKEIGLRLVKGAYKEPASIAYPALSQVNESFIRLIRYRLEREVYTGIATHDEAIIDWVKQYVRHNGIPSTRYEFQMLYGVRTPLQEQLAREGYKIRCYVPFGRMWYPYFVRRLAERPANTLFVIKNMIKG